MDAIKTYDEEPGINVIGNRIYDKSTSNVNDHCPFKPIDKIVELYEKLVASEKEKTELVKKMMDK